MQLSIFLNGSDAKAEGCVPCRSGMWRAGCNAKVLCKTGASRALTALHWATVFVVDLHLSGRIVTQQSHMYDHRHHLLPSMLARCVSEDMNVQWKNIVAVNFLLLKDFFGRVVCLNLRYVELE